MTNYTEPEGHINYFWYNWIELLIDLEWMGWMNFQMNEWFEKENEKIELILYIPQIKVSSKKWIISSYPILLATALFLLPWFQILVLYLLASLRGSKAKYARESEARLWNQCIFLLSQNIFSLFDKNWIHDRPMDQILPSFSILCDQSRQNSRGAIIDRRCQ